MKKFWAVVVCIGLTIPGLSTQSQADTVIDEQALIPPPPVADISNTVGWTGAYADDSQRIDSQSFLAESTAAWTGDDALCSSLEDSKCAGKSTVFYNAFLPPCGSTTDTNCIDAINAILKDGSVSSGSFQQYFPVRDKAAYSGDPSKGLPSGWYPSIWSFSGVEHQGGNQFLAAIQVSSGGWPLIKDMKKSNLLTESLFPISIEPKTDFGDTFSEASITTLTSGLHRLQIGGVTDRTCPLYLGDHQCAVQWPFPQNVRYQIKVRISFAMNGWFNGRTGNPDVQVTKVGAEGQTLSITASPLKVPILSVWKKYVDLPPQLQAYLKTQTTSGAIYAPLNWQTIWDHQTTPPWEKMSILRSFFNYDSQEFNEFSLWLQASENRSYVDKTEWQVKSVASGPYNSCFAGVDGVAGTVSSNATMYIASPPTFDSTTQTLDYKVAAPHYDRLGNVNVGSYDLVINSATARCLYGFTSAPLKAAVSVVSNDGQTQVATNSLSEKDGWLHLSVQGFNYSSPTLKVKFTQDGEVARPKQASPIAKVQPPKSISTITCINVQTHALKTFPSTPAGCPNHYKLVPTKKK